MSSAPAKVRIDFSIMRIVATLAVILLHTCSTIELNPDLFPTDQLQHHIVYFGMILMNWAVPVFFMLTGALILDPAKEITTSAILKKYCRRIVLALLIFGIPFSWLESIATSGFSWSMFPLSIFNVLSENSWGHLWYLYALLAIYLTLPVWKGYVKSSGRKTQGFVLVVLFALCFLRAFICNLFHINFAPHLSIVMYSVFYLLAGWYLKEELPGWLRNKKRTAVFLAIAAAVLTVIGILTNADGYGLVYYDSPVIALLAVFIFAVMIGDKPVKQKTAGFIWEVDRLCFCVYLVHPVFINFSYKYLGITPLMGGKLTLLLVFVFFIVFTLLGFAVSWVLNKIKPLNKYVL